LVVGTLWVKKETQPTSRGRANRVRHMEKGENNTKSVGGFGVVKTTDRKKKGTLKGFVNRTGSNRGGGK